MTTDSPDRTLTVEQAAAYLQLSVDDVLAELEEGLIPGRKFRGQWRISLASLRRLLEGPGPPTPTHLHVGTSQMAVLAPETEGDQSPVAKDWVAIPEAKDEPPAEAETVLQQIEPGQVESQAQSEAEPIHQTDSDEDGVYPAFVEELERVRVEPFEAIPRSKPGREHARVFSYNVEQGYGSGRLMDNHYVFLDSRNLVDQSYKPFPGDLIEIEPFRNRKRGLEGLGIELVRRAGNKKPVEKTEAPPKRDLSPAPPPDQETKPIPNQPKPAARAPNHNGTPESQELFQQASVARGLDQIPKARDLFRKAIRAGAGTAVFTAYFKMEEPTRGMRTDERREQLRLARRVISDAIETFPTFANFYLMYGQMERRERNYRKAEEIFRQGLAQQPVHNNLQFGLAQSLVQLGTEESLKEAGEIFKQLEKRKVLNKDDTVYQRWRALQESPRANRAYDFFRMGGMPVGIAGRKDLPSHITDIIVDITNQELNESFGLLGGFLVRCFQRPPSQLDIHKLGRFLKDLGPQPVIGVQDGRDMMLNPTLAFIAVPKISQVHDQVMSILSESQEAIVPLDDELLSSDREPMQVLSDSLVSYLGRRDLYDTANAVSGRRHFGRENLLSELAAELHRGEFVGIYGLRKMGKTSLVYQLREVKLKDDAVAYLDLQISDARSVGHCGPLYWEAEKKLYDRLKGSSPDAARLLRLGKAESYYELNVTLAECEMTFREDMRRLLDAIVNLEVSGVRRVIIVLDELEKILPVGRQTGVEGYIEFFSALRGLSQTDRYRGKIAGVVVAANASISERGYWEDRENPVFALYKTRYLKPLLLEETQTMITTLGRGMAIYWEDDAIDDVYAETDGHPYITRLLCSRIIKPETSRPLTVTKAMVQEAIPSFIRDEGDKLEQIIELLSKNFPEEEKLLRRLAMDDALPDDVSDESVRHLLGYQLLAAKNETFTFQLNVLRHWLRRRAGIRE